MFITVCAVSSSTFTHCAPDSAPLLPCKIDAVCRRPDLKCVLRPCPLLDTNKKATDNNLASLLCSSCRLSSSTFTCCPLSIPSRHTYFVRFDCTDYLLLHIISHKSAARKKQKAKAKKAKSSSFILSVSGCLSVCLLLVGIRGCARTEVSVLVPAFRFQLLVVSYQRYFTPASANCRVYLLDLLPLATRGTSPSRPPGTVPSSFPSTPDKVLWGLQWLDRVYLDSSVDIARRHPNLEVQQTFLLLCWLLSRQRQLFVSLL